MKSNRHSRSVPSLQSRLLRWVQSHGESAAGTLKSLLITPFTSMLTISIFAVIMSLPVALYWAILNISQWVDPWAKGGDITVFMRKGVAVTQVQDIVVRLQQDVDVLAVKIITPEEALQSFNSFSGMQDVAASLGENPLPVVMLVTPKTLDSSVIDRLNAAIKADPRVEQLQFDTAWVVRLQSILSLVEHMTIVIAALLSAGLLLVTGHSVHSAVVANATEIMVAKWVGATDAFVRRPFLYAGFWLGTIGSVMGLILVSISFSLVSPALDRMLESYGSLWQAHWLSFGAQVSIIALCASLGVMGAWIATTHYLYTVRPR